MADLHMEALSDEELVEVADQALASLNARFVDDMEGTGRERFGAEAVYVAAEVEAVCDAWDVFANRYREA